MKTRTEYGKGGTLEAAAIANGAPHPGWVRFFTYVQGIRSGLITRLVIQDCAPIFLEHACFNLALNSAGEDQKCFPAVSGPVMVRAPENSEGWSRLVSLAHELKYCEFHDLEILEGVPVKVGKLVNKEKLA
ncbi:MAG: hypothetical protein HY751_11880 [Nitrospinae bacterium]|nr:hypothetical protein [Nitrospinota bacterium]